MTAEPATGSYIGRYVVLRKLGEGGMGRVYLARSPGGRRVAVKTIRSEFLAVPGFRERFRAEAAAARRVSGAFTAPVIEADADAPEPWLATAYIEAPTLAQRVSEGGALPAPQVRRLAAGLAEALASVHAAGVVHGDLKPENIMLAVDGPRLIDFGIAGAVDAPAAGSGRRPIGTPGYISPERWLGHPATQAADVFALGAVLCFAATGSGPFGTGPADAVAARSAKLPPDLRGIRDPLVHRIAERCLSREPGRRPRPADVLAMLRDGMSAPVRSRLLSGRRRRVLFLTLAGCAAIALALALTLPNHRGGDAAPGFAWSVPGRSGDAYVGLWGGSADVVYGAELSGLTAYAVAGGARLWTWRPPAGDALCGMSATTDQGMAVFDYGKLGSGAVIDCDHLQSVATATGRLDWSAPLILDAGTGATPSQSGGKALSIGDGVVSAPYYGAADAKGLGSDSDLLAASLSTGKAAWTTDFGAVALPDGCVMTGVAQVFDGRVYSLGDCGGAGQVDLLTVGGSAPSDVHVVGSLGDCAETSASSVAGFLASDGDYLLIACPGENENEGLYSLRRGGTALLALDSSAAAAISVGAGGNQPVPGGVVLDGATVYLASSSDSVAAISLATGHQLWTHRFPGATNVAALAADSSSVQVAAVYSSTATVDVVTLAANGSVRGTRALDSSAESAFDELSVGANQPYAVVVGEHTAVAFPGSTGPSQTALGELP